MPHTARNADVLGATVSGIRAGGARHRGIRGEDPVNTGDEPGQRGATTLEGGPGWQNATVVSGDASTSRRLRRIRAAVALARQLSMNRAMMAAGLVDRVQLTLFPVITVRTGAEQIFEGAADST